MPAPFVPPTIFIPHYVREDNKKLPTGSERLPPTPAPKPEMLVNTYRPVIAYRRQKTLPAYDVNRRTSRPYKANLRSTNRSDT